jgi:hypothetical protein
MGAAIPLSLIVPVYNVAPFLLLSGEPRAVDPNTAEIVVVTTVRPTVSTPSRGVRRRHSRPRREAPERRPSAAAIRACTCAGHHVAFADSDDWFDAGYYERLSTFARARARHGGWQRDVPLRGTALIADFRRRRRPAWFAALSFSAPGAQPVVPAHGLDVRLLAP